MPTPHYHAEPITRGSIRRGKVRPARAGGSAAEKLLYIERGGEHVDDLDDVLALGLSGPDLRDWRKVDRFEIRKDALVGREIVCAIPITLSLAEQTRVAKRHARMLRRLTGCAVRWALHRAGEGDQRNTHIHFLITPRRVSDGGEFATSKETAFDPRGVAAG